MREIKFRAWSEENGAWCGGFSVHKSGAISSLINAKIDKDSGQHISDAHWDENDLILEQYTGLKDKNGKEIYEGDIIEWFDTGSNYPNTIHFLETVYFENGEFRNCRSIYAIEIKGNIHENTELLTN